jgi:hypothetical protein
MAARPPITELGAAMAGSARAASEFPKDSILDFVIFGEMKSKIPTKSVRSERELNKTLEQAKIPEMAARYWKEFPQRVMKRIRASTD